MGKQPRRRMDKTAQGYDVYRRSEVLGRTGQVISKFFELRLNRSTRVTLYCVGFCSCNVLTTFQDSETRVSDPNEPNKCEYTLNFHTPVACNKQHLELLELDLLGDSSELLH
jgi:hypothetical protein